jgi:RNA polymerase sigma-70 factor (ECF subfamily)
MDRSLVERAQQGDREAFSALAIELSDRLFGVAHRILRDFDAASDALQVALVRMWRDLPGLRDPELIEGWAYKVMVRACHDALRLTRRRSPALRAVAEVASVADHARAFADREALERAFRKLSVEQRAAVVLQYYRDLTLPEIAEVLGVPVGTVRSRLHYAKRVLRSAIEADARPPAREERNA